MINQEDTNLINANNLVFKKGEDVVDAENKNILIEKSEEKKEGEETRPLSKTKHSEREKEKAKNPVWLSVSEAAKIGGVQNKTIRRAVKNFHVKFKVVGNRYLIRADSLIIYLHNNVKLKNKLNEHGIGQYVENWKNNIK